MSDWLDEDSLREENVDLRADILVLKTALAVHERGGKCSECDGSGDEMVDSMTLYGVPGGFDVGGPCPACAGTGSLIAEQSIGMLRAALQALYDATEMVTSDKLDEAMMAAGRLLNSNQAATP